eukprot:1142646-Pelagomonas_calceolata.AAC.1
MQAAAAPVQVCPALPAEGHPCGPFKHSPITQLGAYCCCSEICSRLAPQNARPALQQLEHTFCGFQGGGVAEI